MGPMYVDWSGDIMSGLMTNKGSLKDTTLVKSRFMVTPKERSLKVGDDSKEEEENQVDRGRELLKTYSLLRRSS